MDLLDRYLAAVRRNLPAKTADDIVAELRDLLLAQAEEQEERHGRVDWTALLRDFGHPLTVAGRYRTQQWLVGPELFPFYLYFLKMIGGIVAAVMIVTAVAKGILHEGPPGPVIVGLLGSLWWSLAGTVGSVTIVFALIERYGGVNAHFRNWKPGDLPELSDLLGAPKKRWESAFEVAMGVLAVLWWLGVVRIPYATNADFRLEPAPIWAQLYWPILALLVARLLYDSLRWLMPRARWLIGLFGIASTAGLVAMAAILYRAGEWVTIVSTELRTTEVAELQEHLNLAIGSAIVAAAVIWTVQYFMELWRWARAR